MGAKSQVMLPHGDSGGQRPAGSQRCAGLRGAEGRTRDQRDGGWGAVRALSPGRLGDPIPPPSCRDAQALPGAVKRSRTTPAAEVCAEREGEGDAASKAPRGTGAGRASCSPGSLHSWGHKGRARSPKSAQTLRAPKTRFSTSETSTDAQPGPPDCKTSLFSHRKVLRQDR